MHLHVFSRFYKRKQIADFLFASLDYKALPICLTLKKKDFAPKGSSLYLKSWSPPRMKTHGVHIKLRQTILLPLKLYLFTLSFQSKSPTELWMFLLCSNFYKEENVCSNNLSFEFFPFHFCYVLWTTFPGNIVVRVVHKWHDGLKNKKTNTQYQHYNSVEVYVLYTEQRKTRNLSAPVWRDFCRRSWS